MTPCISGVPGTFYHDTTICPISPDERLDTWSVEPSGLSSGGRAFLCSQFLTTVDVVTSIRFYKAGSPAYPLNDWNDTTNQQGRFPRRNRMFFHDISFVMLLYSCSAAGQSHQTSNLRV